MDGPRTPRFALRAALAAGLCLLCSSSSALKATDQFTLKDLEGARALSPEQFAGLFERFFYEFSPRVLPPEDFLYQRAGDCDDYAILGDHILRRNGYKTRLIQVQLAGSNVDHAVCFVTDKDVYLDYNNRRSRRKLVKSNPTVRDVAVLVADSFKQNWTTAYEFTYTYAEPFKKTRWVIVKTDSPDRDADRRTSPQARP